MDLEVTKNIEHDSPPSHKNNSDKLRPLFSNAITSDSKFKLVFTIAC